MRYLLCLILSTATACAVAKAKEKEPCTHPSTKKVSSTPSSCCKGYDKEGNCSMGEGMMLTVVWECLKCGGTITDKTECQ